MTSIVMAVMFIYFLNVMSVVLVSYALLVLLKADVSIAFNMFFLEI